jgi:hypothetical protein
VVAGFEPSIDGRFSGVHRGKVFVLIASKQSIGAHQVIREVEQAHEREKLIVPIRVGITHVEFASASPILRMASGTAVSLAAGPSEAATIAKRIRLTIQFAERETSSNGNPAPVLIDPQSTTQVMGASKKEESSVGLPHAIPQESEHQGTQVPIGPRRRASEHPEEQSKGATASPAAIPYDPSLWGDDIRAPLDSGRSTAAADSAVIGADPAAATRGPRRLQLLGSVAAIGAQILASLWCLYLFISLYQEHSRYFSKLSTDFYQYAGVFLVSGVFGLLCAALVTIGTVHGRQRILAVSRWCVSAGALICALGVIMLVTYRDFWAYLLILQIAIYVWLFYTVWTRLKVVTSGETSRLIPPE